MPQRYDRRRELVSKPLLPEAARSAVRFVSMLRRRSPIRSAALLVAAAFGIAACTGGDDPVPAPALRPIPSTVAPDEPVLQPVEDAGPVEANVGTIEWREVVDGVDEGFLTVPLDYSDPDGATIDLYITRHSATKDNARIGALLVNNGGPGSAASSMGINATRWFDEALTDRFDVVAWDPRGTGISGGSVDCIDDDEYDDFFARPDITPDDDEELTELRELAERFAQRCIDRVGPELAHIGTNNSARDMDSIRRALGEQQVSFFGFSYGSELGATWATLFPTTVRAAVLDGAADPDADAFESSRQQRVGFESALSSFLAACSANSDCEFHNDGDAEGAFDELLADLDIDPLKVADDRAEVNLGVAVTGVARAMYNDTFWPALERALSDADNGDGAGLLQLQDSYYQRTADGEYSDLLESFQAILCADDAERPTIAEADAEALELLEFGPRLFPYTAGSYTCSFFPDAVDPRIEVTGVGAGPLLVVGTTGDPSTPLDSSRSMAEALEDGRLVVVEANQHTGYNANDCIDDTIHDYLIQLVAPPSETRCS